MGLAIDRFIGGKDLPGLLRTVVLMLAVYVLSNLFQVIANRAMARLSQWALKALRKNLFSHLQTLSMMDTRTEVRIQRALLRLMQGRTSFVIAHRLSTIRDADRVVVINNGEIVEQGSHQELLDLHGFYHHLYLSQFKGNAI